MQSQENNQQGAVAKRSYGNLPGINHFPIAAGLEVFYPSYATGICQQTDKHYDMQVKNH